MRWLTIIVAVLGLAFVAAGCGGDDEGAGDTDTVTITDETTTDETDTDDTETDASGSFASGECAELISAAASLGQALSGGTSDADDVSEFFEGLADEAPEEIRSDLQVLADAYGEMIAAFEDLGLQPGETPSAADAAEYQQALAALATPEVAAASERLSAWTDENCSG
jgi:hypothetical protein